MSELVAEMECRFLQDDAGRRHPKMSPAY